MKPLLLTLSMVSTLAILGCHTEIDKAVASGDADTLLIALNKNGDVDWEIDTDGNVISIWAYLTSPASAKVTDEVLAIFSELPHLKDLDLGRTKLSDASLEHLKSLRNLERFSCEGDFWDGCNITDEGLKSLGGLNQLKHLHIVSNKITDGGLSYLKDLTELETLGLHNSQITGAGFSQLKGMTKLQGIDLNGSKLSDDGLKHLAAIENLYILGLDNTRISGVGCDCLANLTQLFSVSLMSNPISDAGIEDLKKLTNLRSLNLISTQLTPNDIMELKAALPNCRIKSEHRIP